VSLRSFLFVPGNSERKLEKAQQIDADALILDLEDGVAAENLTQARVLVAQFLEEHSDRSQRQLWVRIGDLGSGQALDDLSAVVRAAPDGIVLPKSKSGADVTTLDRYLSALEVRDGVERGSIRILPIATETAQSVFHLESYSGCSERLYGLTWGAEDLSAAVGASAKRTTHGSLSALYLLARSLCLAGARAAGVEPIDGVYTDYRDLEGLQAETRAALRDGFTAKIAIHPAQIEVIHEAMRPSDEEIETAQAIVAAFAAQPGTGTVGLEGRMLDRPHLRQAERVLERAGR
jgi:citrate lyase subunit beta/citryl-CoA lyase